MNYLPLILLLTLPPAFAANGGDDTPLTLNGCLIAESSRA